MCLNDLAGTIFFIDCGGKTPVWKICIASQQAKEEAVQYSPQRCLKRATDIDGWKKDSTGL
jgi:hypothetical protein